MIFYRPLFIRAYYRDGLRQLEHFTSKTTEINLGTVCSRFQDYTFWFIVKKCRKYTYLNLYKIIKYLSVIYK